MQTATRGPVGTAAAARGGDDWKANSFAIAEIFGYVAGLGDMQRDIVYTAVRDAYRARGYAVVCG